ncbi:unnamed protein product [Eretmochelys imbricata]
MGYRDSLGFALLCWVVSGVTCYNPWDFSRIDSAIWRRTPRAEPPQRQAHVSSLAQPSPWARVDASQLRAVSLLQPVMVQCEEAQMVITVHRDLFGMGRLIKAADLSLGQATCRYTSLNAAENTVTFAAGLHECGSTLQMTPDSLVYSTSLNYNPTPASNPVILRTNPAVIPIECHYPSWSPVEGTRDICRCCETGNCAFLGGQSGRGSPLDRWSGRRFQRDVASRHGEPLVREAEADVVVGPIIILDTDQGSRDLSVAQMEAEKAASEEFSSTAGLISVAAAIALAFITLGILVYRRCSRSSA